MHWSVFNFRPVPSYRSQIGSKYVLQSQGWIWGTGYQRCARSPLESHRSSGSCRLQPLQSVGSRHQTAGCPWCGPSGHKRQWLSWLVGCLHPSDPQSWTRCRWAAAIWSRQSSQSWTATCCGRCPSGARRTLNLILSAFGPKENKNWRLIWVDRHSLTILCSTAFAHHTRFRQSADHHHPAAAACWTSCAQAISHRRYALPLWLPARKYLRTCPRSSHTFYRSQETFFMPNSANSQFFSSYCCTLNPVYHCQKFSSGESQEFP